MRGYRAGPVLAVLLLWAAPSALAQTSGAGFRLGNPFNSPVMRKYWNPMVGAGAAFELTDTAGKKLTEEWDILSEETVEGKKAYWVGFALDNADTKGKVNGKILVIPDGFEVRRLIIQFPGIAAMEMPIADIIPPTDEKDTARLLGTETITVPGGTFECEHWREANGADAWVSAKVAPLKVVKRVDRNQTRMLVRTISAAKDAVTGPVKPYDPEVIEKLLERQSKRN